MMSFWINWLISNISLILPVSLYLPKIILTWVAEFSITYTWLVFYFCGL